MYVINDNQLYQCCTPVTYQISPVMQRAYNHMHQTGMHIMTSWERGPSQTAGFGSGFYSYHGHIHDIKCIQVSLSDLTLKILQILYEPGRSRGVVRDPLELSPWVPEQISHEIPLRPTVYTSIYISIDLSVYLSISYCTCIYHHIPITYPNDFH